MADVDQQIQSALKEGHSFDVIFQAIKQRAEDSPDHAAWLKNFEQQRSDVKTALDEQSSANPPSAVTAGPPTDKTPTIASQIGKSVSKWYEETPAPLIAAEGAGGLAALELGRRAIANIVPTPGERVQRQQNELRQQELELQRQKLATGTTLSPYEQARAETEKLRAQQIQQQIELEAKQFELSKIKAEQAQAAAQERAAAKLQIKDPVEQRLAEISKSQGYGGNIAPAGNVVPQINPMQPQPAPPPEIRPVPVAPTPTVSTTVTPAPVETSPVVTAPVSETPPPAPVEEIKPAPIAETPKAPAPPPEVAPKAAVPPEEKLTKQQKGMKGHLVSMYGGGPEGEAAYAKVKEILGYTPEYPPNTGGSLTSEEHQIIKDWRKANIEGPKVNLTKEMKKGMTSGAGLAVLMSIPGFAEAAQNRDFGKMTDIATDLFVLPFAQSRATGENESYELAKRRYEGMVGGGRGIAPPSPRQQVGRR